jgi:hypothetical protein
MVLGDGDTKLTRNVERAVKKSSKAKLGEAIDQVLERKAIKSILEDKSLGSIKLNNKGVKANIRKNLLDPRKGAVRTIAGFVQEGLIGTITGASIAGDNEAFDFPDLTSDTTKSRLNYCMEKSRP